jgi:Mrp family chromosome partitioning ATPase
MGVVAQPEVRDPDLGRLLRLAWRWGWLLVLAAVLGGLAASSAGSRGGTKYRATAVVLVGPIGGDYNTLRAAGQQAQTLSQVASSRPVLRGAQRRLGAAAEGSLEARVAATADEATRLVTITTTAKTASHAALAANAVAAELAAKQRASTAAIQAAALEATRATGKQAPSAAALKQAAAAGDVTLAAPAQPPSGPVKRAAKPLAAIAALAAMLLVLSILLIWDFFRGRVAVERDMTELTGLPHLATLRRSRRIGPGKAEAQRAAAGYELLAGRVELARPEQRCRSVVVSSAGSGERSGDVAANLAAALAAKGSRVILLDADPDARHVTSVLGLHDRAGLGELLTSAGERPPVADLAIARSRHLSVVALGAVEGHQLIDARRAARVLDRVLEDADIVVVSAGAAGTSAAALAWARCADGTVLLARRNGTRRDELERAKEALTEVGARVLGSVLAENARVRRRRLPSATIGRRLGRPRVIGRSERPGEASS